MEQPKEGDLKVWWIPQIPGKAFEVPVVSVDEAKKLLNVLGEYDAFQFNNRIKGDYCNAGGLVVYEIERIDGMDHRGDWVDWTNEDGDSIDDLRRL
jgi:hypothetical protein